MFAGIHLYTWVERGTVRVNCLAQEHNTMSPARARTWTTRSGVERTSCEATLVTDSLVPLMHFDQEWFLITDQLWSRSPQRNAPLDSILRFNYFVFCSLFLEWYWRVWMLPSLLRITAVLLFLLSVTLVWSEVTFFNVKPVLSIFAQMIHSASEGYYYFYVEVCACKWHVVAWSF